MVPSRAGRQGVDSDPRSSPLSPTAHREGLLGARCFLVLSDFANSPEQIVLLFTEKESEVWRRHVTYSRSVPELLSVKAEIQTLLYH